MNLVSLLLRISACFAAVVAPALCVRGDEANGKQKDDSTGSQPVARIGDEYVITRDEFERALSAYQQVKMVQARARGATDANAEILEVSGDEKLRVLNNMIDLKILFEMAKKEGIQVSDEEINQEIDTRADDLPDNTTMENFLQRQGMDLEDVREVTRQRLMTNRFKELRTKNVIVTEEEVAAEYERLKSRGLLETVDVAHILIRVDGQDIDADKKAREAIEAAYQRVKNGEDFATVAREVSEDPGSKEKGGVYTGVRRGQMVQDFSRRMMESGIGEVSEPFRTQFGWHILKVLARGTAPFEGKLKDDLQALLLNRKQRAIVREIVESARAGMNIQMMLPADAGSPKSPPPSQGADTIEDALDAAA
jgi:parvulin-like peptidyl-prolyl isomerase